ncbi:MAG TPA: alanine racemase [Candidatus Paceibacterota bacterium]|nr:alanine racemase [Candidatus Paceibacterota bacterium]
MKFLTWLRRKRFPYEPLITIEVSRDRLLHNFREFAAFAPDGHIAPILKANAYGHGLLAVAQFLEQNAEKIPFFGVDSYFEAIALHAKGVRMPLLIIGYTRLETIKTSLVKNISFTVTTMDTLRSISTIENKIKIHLKIDTGMHRQGIRPEEITEAMDIIKKNQSIILEGVYTHLNDADNTDESYTKSQIELWNRYAKEIKSQFPNIKYVHAASTDGSRFSKNIVGNVLRLGIGLYGITENEVLNSSLTLLPVLKMKTILTSVKKLNKGEATGYGNTFRTEKNILIGTIPIGYSEGLDRRLSSNGAVQIGQNKAVCPFIGRVSMNISTIDISSVENPAVGMEAIVISDNPKDPNSIQSIAKNCKTITYEIAVKIPAHLKRVMV